MADNPQEQDGAKAARTAQREAARAVEPDEPKFPVERLLGPEGELIAERRPDVIAGALHGIAKKELTVAEVQAACDASQAAVATTDPGYAPTEEV